MSDPTTLSDLIDLIESDCPDDWMMTFLGYGNIELEWFSESYIGDKESGCGNKRFEGEPQEVFESIRAWLDNKEV